MWPSRSIRRQRKMPPWGTNGPNLNDLRHMKYILPSFSYISIRYICRVSPTYAVATPYTNKDIDQIAFP